MRTIIKSANEEIVEEIDYSRQLAKGDYLQASAWTVESGLTGVNEEIKDTVKAKIELTGGTETTQYRVSNLVTTKDGEKFERSFDVLVRGR